MDQAVGHYRQSEKEEEWTTDADWVDGDPTLGCLRLLSTSSDSHRRTSASRSMSLPRYSYYP